MRSFFGEEARTYIQLLPADRMQRSLHAFILASIRLVKMRQSGKSHSLRQFARPANGRPMTTPKLP
jgi:hypothetical protein